MDKCMEKEQLNKGTIKYKVIGVKEKEKSELIRKINNFKFYNNIFK
jgi:hypothetical protein